MLRTTSTPHSAVGRSLLAVVLGVALILTGITVLQIIGGVVIMLGLLSPFISLRSTPEGTAKPTSERRDASKNAQGDNYSSPNT